jgi:2-keto-4-pentenoate hydratase
MNVNEFALRLRKAQEERKLIDPIRYEIGVEDIELAYQIQEINIQHRVKNGAELVGKKIGLTSTAVQKQLGVDQPDFGVLLNTMEVLNGQSIDTSEILQPKVEAEYAVVLGDDLDRENLTILDVISAIDYVLPAIEIVGSRIANWDIKITDTIADNASASHYVLGHRPKTIDELDIIGGEVNLFKNGQMESSGTGGDCLGSPLNAILWLARKMVEMDCPLQEGELIFTGAIGKMVNVQPGDYIEAHFESLGNVTVSFT